MTTIEEMTPEEFQKAREHAIKELQKREANSAKDKLYHQQYFAKNKVKVYAKHKQHNIEHKDEQATYMKQYREQNKEVLKEKRVARKERTAMLAHKRWLENRERLFLQQQRHRLKNKEARIAWDHQHYLDNKDRILAHCHKYYIDHKEETAKHDKQYYLEHPEVAKACNARRRARKLLARGTFTAKELRQKCIKYRNMCVYCGEKVLLGPDHAIPLSKGGSNSIDNILPCCKSCNSSKSTKSFEEFLHLHTQEEQESILTRIFIAEYAGEGN